MESRCRICRRRVAEYCDRLQVGQEFQVDETGAMPAGFCTWAWHDIYPTVTDLRFGGNFPWMKTEGGDLFLLLRRRPAGVFQDRKNMKKTVSV